jgi:DNA-directed RNA polymerase subunit RPC12/RpoP
MHHERLSFKRDYLEEDFEKSERKYDKKKHFVKNEYDPDYDKTPRRSSKTIYVHKCVSCGERFEGSAMSLPKDWKNTKMGIQCPECANEDDLIVEVDRIEL